MNKKRRLMNLLEMQNQRLTIELQELLNVKNFRRIELMVWQRIWKEQKDS
jgi:CRISPR/Cas system endoribonuclease Cas6 (RAMP superfamily)